MNQFIVVALSLCVSFAYGAGILSTDRPTVAPLNPNLRVIFSMKTNASSSNVTYDVQRAKIVKGSFIKDDVDVDPEAINSIKFSSAEPQTFGARGSTSNKGYPDGYFEVHQNNQFVASFKFGKKPQFKSDLKVEHSCEQILISAPGATDLKYEIACNPQK